MAFLTDFRAPSCSRSCVDQLVAIWGKSEHGGTFYSHSKKFRLQFFILNLLDTDIHSAQTMSGLNIYAVRNAGKAQKCAENLEGTHRSPIKYIFCVFLGYSIGSTTPFVLLADPTGCHIACEFVVAVSSKIALPIALYSSSKICQLFFRICI